MSEPNPEKVIEDSLNSLTRQILYKRKKIADQEATLNSERIDHGLLTERAQRYLDALNFLRPSTKDRTIEEYVVRYNKANPT